MNQPDTPNSTVRFLTVGENQDGQRLDNFLITALKGAPRTLVYRIVRTGEVRVNKGRARPDTRVHDGDVVRVPPLRLAEENPSPVPGAGLSRSLRERVLYHQDGLIVINKPAGLAVHGGSGVPFGVIEAMRAVFPEKDFLELVHRLDRDTSGLLMVAEKRSVLRELHEQLRQGRMRKTYVALLAGNLGGQHTVTAPLHKGNLPNGERIVRVSRDGKEAKTVFRVIERFANATLVEASPLTGRTHQIRVHAQFLGHPILGDEKYGQDETNKAARAWGLNRLFLHARALTLTMPGKEKPLALECPLADDLQAVLEVLRHAPRYDLVIFDWDGTLMNSTDHIVECLQEAARDTGLPEPTAAAARHIIGLALPLAIEQLFPGVDADLRELIRQRYAHHFIHGSDSKSALYPGAIELLDDLREAGSLMAIATGKSRPGLDRVLAQTGIGHYFTMTRCADETASKPDPRMLHEILAATGVHPLQAVMVGDTSYDLEMARRIAMPSLGIRHGAHDEALMHPHAPLAVVDDLPGLRPHLWRAE